MGGSLGFSIDNMQTINKHHVHSITENDRKHYEKRAERITNPQVKQKPRPKNLHPTLDPYCRVRQILDNSEDNKPLVYINITVDLTGSMGLGTINYLLNNEKGLKHIFEKINLLNKESLYKFHLGFAGVGDGNYPHKDVDSDSDEMPYQIGEVEGNETCMLALKNMFIEGKGGCNGSESYQYTILYHLERVQAQHHSKGIKGIIFLVVDEKAAETTYLWEIQKHIDPNFEMIEGKNKIDTAELIKYAKERYEICAVVINTQTAQEQKSLEYWQNMLGKDYVASVEASELYKTSEKFLNELLPRALKNIHMNPLNIDLNWHPQAGYRYRPPPFSNGKNLGGFQVIEPGDQSSLQPVTASFSHLKRSNSSSSQSQLVDLPNNFSSSSFTAAQCQDWLSSQQLCSPFPRFTSHFGQPSAHFGQPGASHFPGLLSQTILSQNNYCLDPNGTVEASSTSYYQFKFESQNPWQQPTGFPGSSFAQQNSSMTSSSSPKVNLFNGGGLNELSSSMQNLSLQSSNQSNQSKQLEQFASPPVVSQSPANVVWSEKDQVEFINALNCEDPDIKNNLTAVKKMIELKMSHLIKNHNKFPNINFALPSVQKAVLNKLQNDEDWVLKLNVDNFQTKQAIMVVYEFINEGLNDLETLNNLNLFGDGKIITEQNLTKILQLYNIVAPPTHGLRP